jgi:hypothetical protein
MWSNDRPIPAVNINDHEDVDFASLDSQQFHLEAYFVPSSLGTVLEPKQTIRIQIEAIAENYTPRKMQELEIYWDGEWDPNAPVMRDKHHFKMRFV